MMAANFKKVHPKEGNTYVLFNEHLYVKSRTGSFGKASYFNCKGRNGFECKASGKIHPDNPDVFVQIKDVHTHEDNHLNELAVVESLEELRNTVKDPLCRRHEAYQNKLAGLDPETRNQWGTYKSMESSLRKLANKEFPSCDTLVNLDLLLNQNARIKNSFGTIDGEPFYHKCLFDGRKRAALFLNPKAVDSAAINDMIFVDGTFRTCPLGCAQLLIIFRIIKETPWFFGFAIMESRKKSLYKLIFEEIKVETVAEPLVFMSDYENSMRAAAKDTWQRIQTPGCTFHYRQAVRRKYQTKVNPKPEKLTPEARAHSTARRMLYNLQFLPAGQILQGARFIQRFQQDNGILAVFAQFNNYFLRYWLRTIRPENFTMYRRHHRTNNICESFNKQLNNVLFKHPNIYAFLQRMVNIVKEENQKRLKNGYKLRSRLTRKLELAWNQLDQGVLTVGDFLQINFSH